jgi:hypothetical protein
MPGDIDMRIRTTVATAITATALLVSGAAFAQSNQGGYLGINPGAHLASAGAGAGRAAPTQGSGQGGYLGIDPGAHLMSIPATPPAQGSGQGGYLGITPRVD